MAEICCGVVSENEAAKSCVPDSRAARRRRMEIRRFRFVAGVRSEEEENELKRSKQEIYPAALYRSYENAVENCVSGEDQKPSVASTSGFSSALVDPEVLNQRPKFGVASVCGRRRDMEDALAIHTSFCRKKHETPTELHYYGVYDGHGCSHVATKCRERLHQLVKEELESKEDSAPAEWKDAMARSFLRMDNEVNDWCKGVVVSNCRCELRAPECDAVGSTAVVAIVSPEKIIVANCGDSRAVLCRNGKAVPLSSDHKPDRPDELNRIQEAGGRVIYWDGPRVLGVLAMSRAIGDTYLKPYVSCEPEVTITDRKSEDEFLILASDGLWDVVPNDTACGVARMCLRGKYHAPPGSETESGVRMEEKISDKACSDASALLTKLALARHSTDNVSVIVVDLRRDT